MPPVRLLSTSHLRSTNRRRESNAGGDWAVQSLPHKDIPMRSLLVTLAAMAVVPAAAFAQDYDAPRNATVNAAGATMLRVDARAGQLRITGRTDLTEVR